MKNFLIALIIIALIGGGVYLVLNYATLFQKEKIAKLEKKIEVLKEEMVPVKFMVTENKNDSIRVAIKFLDLDGNIIKRIVSSLPGQELAFDFFVVPVKDRYIAFPSKIFTNKIAPSEGQQIINEYDSISFPQIFNTSVLTDEQREPYIKLYDKIKAGKVDSINNQFGNMVHDIKDLKRFSPNVVYKIIVHTKGGIEVLEEQ